MLCRRRGKKPAEETPLRHGLMAWWSRPQGAPSLQPCGALLHVFNMSRSLQRLPVLWKTSKDGTSQWLLGLQTSSIDLPHHEGPAETSGAVRPPLVRLPAPTGDWRCRHLPARSYPTWDTDDPCFGGLQVPHSAQRQQAGLDHKTELASRTMCPSSVTPCWSARSDAVTSSTETQRTATRSHSCLWPSNFTTPPSVLDTPSQQPGRWTSSPSCTH